jgi:alpha-tubulin suppressor-like RCC1 family protein
MSALTDASGQYVIQGVPVNAPNPPYTLRLSKDGYEAQETNTVAVTHDQTTVMPSMELLVLRSTIHGDVFLEDSADPSMLQITLEGTQYETSVGSDGSFTMADVMPGNYTVRITPTGDAAARYPVVDLQTTLTAGTSTQLAPITMLLGRGEVTGSVTLEGETDYSNVRVELPLLGMSALTDASGQYVIQGVPVNAPNPPYTLRLSKDGYETQETNTITVTHEQSTVVPALELLVLRGSIHGDAYLEDFADPSMIQVSLVGTASSASADVDGSYDLTDLLPGIYQVRFEVIGGFADRYQSVDVSLILEAGQVVNMAVVTLSLNRGDLTGSVLLEGGTSAEDALVQITELGLAGTVNASGSFHLLGVVAGIYTIRISKSGYTAKSVTGIVVDHNQETTVPEVTLELERGDLSGVAIVEDGDEDAQIQVALVGSTHSATVGTDGNWLIEDVAPGAYLLECSVIGTLAARYQAQEAAVTVVANQVAQIPAITVQVARGHLTGQVTLENETLHTGIAIEVDGEGISVLTNAAGVFSLENLPVGSYTLSLTKENYIAQSLAGINVVVGETTDLGSYELLIQRSTLSGTAILDDGTDHTGIEISLIGESYSATTDASGAWTINDVPPGIYNLLASYSGYASDAAYGFYVGPGESALVPSFELSRKRGVVNGRVLLEDSQDNSGVTVHLMGSSFVTSSDSAGDYSFSVPVGNYDGVQLVKKYFSTIDVTETITVQEQGDATVPTQTLLAASNLVYGNVTRALSESEAAVVGSGGQADYTGIVVALEEVTNGTPAQYQTTTDQSGEYQLDEIPLGTYIATFSFSSAEMPYLEERTLTIDVAKGAPIQVPNQYLREVYVVINNDVEVVTSTDVELQLGATNAVKMKIAHSVEALNAIDWDDALDFAATYNWTLQPTASTDNQGNAIEVAEVFVQFLDANGSTIPEVLPTSDTVRVDVSAPIESMSWTIAQGTAPLGRGDQVRFTLDATNEPEPLQAWVSIINEELQGGSNVYYESFIELYDDGSAGDTTAGDGIFERIYTITGPADTPLTGALVYGYLKDLWQNESVVPTTDLFIQVSPAVQNMAISPDTAQGTATITWDTDEYAYGQLIWKEINVGSNNSVNVGSEQSLAISHDITLTGLSPSVGYSFWVEMTDANGNTTVDLERVFYLRPQAPQFAVALPGNGRFDVRWESPPQDNIDGYNLYRSTDSGQNYTQLNTDGLYNHEALIYHDKSVTNDTMYYYRVAAVDAFGIEGDVAEVFGTPEDKSSEVLYEGGLLPGHTVWTNKYQKVVITNNIEVPLDGSLVVGPGTVTEFDNSMNIEVYGRIALLGERGSESSLDEDDVIIESEDGLVEFKAADTKWGNLVISPRGPAGNVDIYNNQYHSGNIFYRTKITQSSQTNMGETCVNLPSDDGLLTTFALLRSVFAWNDPICMSDGRFLLQHNRFEGNAFSARGLAYLNVTDSVFRANPTTADAIHLGGGGWNTFRANRLKVLHNLGSGVGLRDDASIANSLFSNNAVYYSYPNTQGGASALYVAGSGYPALAFVAMTNNLILDGAPDANEAWLPYGISATNEAIIHNNTIRQKVGRAFSGGSWYNSIDAYLTGNTIEGDVYHGAYTYASTFIDSHLTGVMVGQGSGGHERTYGYNHFIWSAPTDEVQVWARNDESVCEVVTYTFYPDVFTQNTFWIDPATSDPVVSTDTDYCSEPAVLTENYFGPSITSEMESGSNPQDLWVFHDAYDDADLGIIDYEPWATKPHPLTQVDGPVLASPTLMANAGITLTGSATQYTWNAAEQTWDSSAVADTELRWYDENQTYLGLGASMVISDVYPKGPLNESDKFTIWLEATDDDGVVGKAPFYFSLIDDPEVPDDYFWPDTNIDGVYPLTITRPAGLMQGVSAQTSLTLPFTCLPSGCRVECSLDNAVVASDCTSPLQLDNLALGTHTIELQAYDALDNPIDNVLPMTWEIIGPWQEIQMGDRHGCGIDDQDQIHCWGSNNEFALGTGADLNNGANGNSAVPIVTTGGFALQSLSVSSGNDWYYDSFTCGLRSSDDSLWCWGSDDFGALGQGTADVHSAAPLEVTAPSGATGWVKVETGMANACAIDDQERLFCWGYNNHGVLGVGDENARNLPTQVNPGTTWKEVSIGNAHACGIQTDDSLWCWGWNTYGQLGDGTTGGHLTPTSIGATNSWRQVSVSSLGGHTCAIDQDDALWCWGLNSYGLIGVNSADWTILLPAQVGIATDWQSVSTGYAHNCALKADQTLWCWGSDIYGQLGATVGESSSYPVQVGSDADWVSMDANGNSTCGLKTGGVPLCWGRNDYGQLGLGATAGDQASPVPLELP